MSRHTKYLMLFVSAIGLVMSSCDNIDEDNRYIAEEKPVVPPHSVIQNLLIMEFTGNYCTNCPQGAQAIHNISEEYPGRIIAVGLHPEGGELFTRPIGTQDFRCEEAQVMYEYYRPDGFPCAVFNGQSMSTVYSGWYGIATPILAQEAIMTVDAETVYEPETRHLTVDYNITLTNDISEQLSVMVWIMENNIVGYQVDQGKMLSDYVHNHVLRASLNGGWGQTLPSPLSNGEIINGTATLTLSEDWVAENCQIVVYVFRTQSRVVEQATVVDIFETE